MTHTDEEQATRDEAYGFPSGLWRALARRRPPGIPPKSAWRSPLRGPWLTSVFGAVLLVSLPIITITGLLSYIAYGTQFAGQPIPADVGWLHLPYFQWPTNPDWLYRFTQGTHVVLGLVVIPVLLAKLWSVVPKLFDWPPARSFAQVLERLSLLLLVGGALFEFATGVLNIQYDYIFGFSFYTGHYYGAWVFIAGLLVHVGLKLPIMWKALRSRSFREELRTSRADTRPEPPDPDGLVATDPADATVSRRGALALVGGGSLLIFVLSAGQTLGGFTRQFALLMPRARETGDNPNDFPINKTAEASGIPSELMGDSWRLSLTGGAAVVQLDRAQLLAMEQHTAELPIACVEGWSTVQTWTGVRLRDLAALAGVPEPSSAFIDSLQEKATFGQAYLQSNQVLDPDSLLALQVNGVDLSLDHGYPARIIVPALPGVHNTKWVRLIEFEEK